MMNNRKPLGLGKSFLIALGIVALAVLVSAVLIYTAPRTKRVEGKRPPRLVQTMKLEARTTRITVTAHGIVIPAREVILQPEVTGRVIRQHESLVPGGYIPMGEELIRIDPSDYDLTLEEKEAALEEAKFELAVEKGRQVVASREWKLLQGDLPGSDANRSLVLRKPHLEKAEALVRKANNQIEKAKLDLSRTTVMAPFNVVVLNEMVEVGQLVDRGTAVCTLAGSDEFWVRVSLPIDKLRWIQLPSGSLPGAKAKVFLESGQGESVGREGRVIRLLSDLDTKGRMARILVSVPDPLGLQNGEDKLPLLLGSYVRVEIDAGELDDVIEIPRSSLREGNCIWVVGRERQLEIRKAKILWSRKETLLLASDCIEDDEDLVVSGLRIALPKMNVSPQPIHRPSGEEEPGAGNLQGDE